MYVEIRYMLGLYLENVNDSYLLYSTQTNP